MNESRFPTGWDAERVKRLIAREAGLSEDEQVSEDDSGSVDHDGQVVVTVPEELLPAIRKLIAEHKVVAK